MDSADGASSGTFLATVEELSEHNSADQLRSGVMMLIAEGAKLMEMILLSIVSRAFDRQRRRKANYLRYSSYSQANWTKEVSRSIYSKRAFFWYQRRLDP
jgi:hypothetical protein